LGERAGPVLGGLFPLASGIIMGLRLEGLFRGTGYLICHAFKNDIAPGSAWIVVIDLLFWAVLVGGTWYLYGYASEMLPVDRRLDAGGVYDYQTGECVYH
jgi:hypothetical protein